MISNGRALLIELVITDDCDDSSQMAGSAGSVSILRAWQ